MKHKLLTISVLIDGEDRSPNLLYKEGKRNHSPAPHFSVLMDILISLLLIAFVVVSALLILVVLMQRPKQEGLGAAFGSGMTDQMFGANTTSVLQKGTAYFGTAFMIIALVLSILIAKRNYEQGIQGTSEPVTDVTAAPPVPGANLEESAAAEGGQELNPRDEALKKALQGLPAQPATEPAT
ncbi:MAG TPA: preprotein translocase subunit SecG, partial [Verrucomicrobiales bacterium]|nr:preprotein translocase subunit SecG [Verrucomicrobiales bacterium]